jgi:riboflavin-specific deaminase-like protein
VRAVGAHSGSHAVTEAASQPPALLRRLLPYGGALTAEQVVDALALTARVRGDADPGGRPYLALNMVSTADGRASIGGRSGPLGNRADRELFHALRGVVDAVLIGAGTVRAERYGRMVRDAHRRERRRARGLALEPLACVVSARLDLPADLPLLAEPAARVVILTPSSGRLAETAARVEYVRAQRDGRLDLPAALGELHTRYAVGTLLCEGGPHLNAQLLAADLVDELFLSVAPKLAGGAGGALAIVAGAELVPPVALELQAALESDSHLFLHYRVADSPGTRAAAAIS